MEIKRISELCWKVSPNWFFVSMVLGVITGLVYSMLIPFLLYAVGTNIDIAADVSGGEFSYFQSPTGVLASWFLCVCLGILVLLGISTALSMYVANKASVEHRLYLYQRIQHLRLADLERIGPARLINILNIDIPNITAASMLAPRIWVSVVTVLGILAYLFYIKAVVFYFVIASLLGVALLHQLPLLVAARYFRRSRDSYDEVQQGVNGLIYGAKELKLNQLKAQNFHRAALYEPEMRSLGDNLKGNTIYAFTHSYGQVASFLVISFVIFQMRYSSELKVAELHGLTMGLLYLAGPVGLILATLGEFNRGKISLRKLGEFYRELNDEPAEGQAPIAAGWTRLTVRNLCYTYTRTADEAPILKNASMTFSRGQITFIVGGNGSGKSTLGKCLSFHYIPSDGEILLDEMKVDDGNRSAARSNVSAIFTDYFLFRRLYARADEAIQAKIAGYLTYLELEDKISLVGDDFSTINLSDGQRKRMALLVLLLEDRPICIFDEWAADQDPRFKEIFYSVILRDLKEQNKVVVVISHDDRYFDSADQIIWMERGTVINTKTVQKSPRGFGEAAAAVVA